MNSSSYNYNVSGSVIYRSTTTLVTKNVVAVALGLIINYINGTLVHTFRKHQIFYMNPRYVLYIHLVMNDMIYLATSISLLVCSSFFNNINVSLCCLFIVAAVFTTNITPLNLAVMAVECYVAVCFPLRHAELCTIKRTYILIGCIWILSSVSFVPDVLINLATDPLWLFYSIRMCSIETLFTHPVSIQKKEITYLLFLTVVWLTLFFTYFKIFFVAQAANSVDGNAKKARNTILLHGFQLLLCMLTYVNPLIQKYLRLFVPQYFLDLQYFCYVFVQILPRFVSPIVYGLRDKTFKQYFKKYMLCNIGKSNKLHPLGKSKLMF